MLAHVKSFGIAGLCVYSVDVEVDISPGIPMFEIVGLPDNAVREARERVRPALRNSGFDLPNMRVIVNLAPAGLRKEGTLYDMPIAVGMLAATGQIGSLGLEGAAFVGELSLNGELRPVNGALPMALEAKRLGFSRIFAPSANAKEMSCVEGVYPVDTLTQLAGHLNGEETLEPVKFAGWEQSRAESSLGFEHIMGQPFAKRAAEIAAAGGHNLLLIGPPGSGKTMLARAIVSILPNLSFEEALEITKIYSIKGGAKDGIAHRRPFCAPHHSASLVSLVGGGSRLMPGAISMAHNGVLFLDELAEFGRNTLEALRQPMEDRNVTIARSAGSVEYPASFMLVAAMNPCPCGMFLSRKGQCQCSGADIKRYLGRISGPLLDRIDIFAQMSEVEYAELSARRAPEPSEKVRERVNLARSVQRERYGRDGIFCNSQLDARMLKRHVKLLPASEKLLGAAFEARGGSARFHSRILKTARTIADLDGCETVEDRHVGEALQYREFDKKYWS